MDGSLGNTSEKRHRRLSKRVIALITAAFIVAFLALWLILNALARSAVECELANIRAKGEPTRWAELALPPVPDMENAAVLLSQASKESERVRGKPTTDLELRGWAEDFHPTRPFAREKVEKWLHFHANAVQVAIEALERPRCRFDIDLSEPATWTMPSLYPLVRLLSAQALLHAHSGRGREAEKTTDALLRLAIVLEEDPLMVSWWCVAAGYGLQTLMEIECVAPLDDDARRHLIARLGKLDCQRAARQEMVSLRAAVDDTAKLFFEGEVGLHGPTNAGLRLTARLFPFHFLRDEARCLRTLTEAVEATDLLPCDALSRLRSIVASVGALPAWKAPFTKVMYNIPAQMWTWRRPYLIWARRDAAVIGLSCELYRSKHGKYPDKPDALAPEFLDKLPPDPFTGRPFVYKPKDDGKGFVVYSVGENLTDDGGVSDHSAGKDDIAWEGTPAAGTR